MTTTIQTAPAKSMDDWLARALWLDGRGECEEALDVIYDALDEMLLAGRFMECDIFLRHLDVEALPVRIILAVAVLTRPASEDDLSSRDAFFGRAWKTLNNRGKDARKLLGNLRGTVPPSRLALLALSAVA